ncbi:type I polyketide synthase [Aspergillus saccharolyticus JOP 1030-1]|uniref:Putative polyketide synthase n=1 Tax=Aspergillus saccharolyticus JOP 1030-1 TaxID=1450539 RepID=A0A319A7R5_9EURO|nr:putative polyketide synthase [Aspergillus saccharolyticus JOP 1030-1]PYH43222.1 putative polyketide synthase [Aspergillus saccharolyticus JOP 1030-1]
MGEWSPTCHWQKAHRPLGCRLPGDIASPSQLWDFLAQDRSAAGPVPPSRFNPDAYTGAKDEPATAVGTGGHFLNHDIRQFDNHFFGINNREAADMDPAQRGLLEVVFECLESAGYSLSAVSGASVGCYVATFLQDHAALSSKDVEWMTRYSATGMGATILANRVSHAFNLTGPSCVINTACSASIYALHQAVSALRNHECESALVAGVNLIQSPDLHVSVSQGGVLSPSSVCHTFDESADGYGRGEGVNAIYLKRLDDALRDGDPIRSIVRGTAVNSNGRTPGITQPSIEGQISVARKAYAQAGLNPADTAYVEMHGTGTAVGDVMEAQSIAGVFAGQSRAHPLLVGGLKPNLGHSEAASGLSSVIKATLALEMKQLPPTIGVVTLNPKLQLERHGIQLVTQTTPFPEPAPGLGRRVSINSFGFGGANAHAIIEEAGPRGRFATSCLRDSLTNDDDDDAVHQAALPSTHTLPFLLPFSASDPSSLTRRVAQLSHLSLPPARTSDLAYTLSQRRTHLKHRGFILARPATLHHDLHPTNLHLPSPSAPTLTPSHRFIHVFTGQGAQWQGMARSLLPIPIFANAMHSLDAALASLPHPPDWTIAGVLQDQSDKCPINEAAFAQPLTTAVQIGLIELLRALRIPTHAVVGHSSGEIAAAYAAGWLDAREAIALAYYRGSAVTRCAPVGAMAALGVGVEKAEEWIHRTVPAAAAGAGGDGQAQVRVACINSPENVTVSGAAEGVEALVAALTAEGTLARTLRTGGKAYHSQQMEVVGPVYEALLEEAGIFARTRPSERNGGDSPFMVSTVLRQQVGEADVRTTAYWRQNLESPVHFSDGLRGVVAGLFGAEVCFVEVGPHPALKMPVLQTLGSSTAYFGTLQRGQDALSAVLELVGGLFASGFPVSFAQIQTLYPTRTGPPPKVLHDLPPYPWHYDKILWNESRVSREVRERKFPRHELLGTPVAGGNRITFGWRNRLVLDHVPWLRDHQLGDATVFPATGYLAMAIEALLQARDVEMSRDLTGLSVSFERVDLPNALPVGAQEAIELYTELSLRAISNLTSSREWFDFQIASIADQGPIIRARGTLKLEPGLPSRAQPSRYADSRLVAKSRRMWYESMHKCGLRYGPHFQHMQDIRTPDTKGGGGMYAQARVADLRPPCPGVQAAPRYLIHPAVLDNVLQAGLVAATGGQLEAMVAKVPKSFSRIVLTAPSSAEQEATIRAAATVTGFASNDIRAVLLGADDNPLVQIEKMSITRYSGSEEFQEEVRYPLYRFLWKPDIDHLPDDAAFAAALDYVRCHTDLGLLPDSSRNLVLALDLAVHKDPNAEILFLSADLSLAALALAEVLKAHTVHQRCNGFHLGRFSADGQLEVAALHRYAAPLGMESFSSWVAAAPAQKFSLVVVGDQTPHLDRVASYSHASTRVIDASHDHGERLLTEKFVLALTLPSSAGSPIRMLRPASAEPGLAHQFDNVLLIRRTPIQEDDDRLKDCLQTELALPVRSCELTHIGPIGDKTLIVSTVELDRDVMARATPEEYTAIQHLLAKPVQMVWTSGSGAHPDADPTRAVFHGLARAIMIEQPATQIFSLELGPHARPRDIACHVRRVLTRPEGCPPDYEYLQSESGLLLVSRGVPDERMNDHFRTKNQGIAVPTPLGSAGPISLSLAKPGQLQSVQFVRTPPPRLGPEEVRVQTSWIGLNAKDVYALAGRVETPGATCSTEFTGTVVAVGSAVRDLAVDDRVAVMYPGQFSSQQVVPAHACVKLRPHEDLRSFASVLVVFATALYALESRAGLQPGESVLIHSATGGAGLAAIQVARMMGAEIFVSVGTEEKKQYLIDHHGIEPDHILHSRQAGFAAQIRALTNGRGVDVVLNSLVGELLLESWDCLAEFGRLVEIGKKDITEHSRLPMDGFARGTTFTAFDLSALATSRAPAVQRVFHQLISRVVALVRSGGLQPVQPLQTFTAAELGPALRHFNHPARLGKIAISFEDPNLLVPVVPERYATQLRPDKSYLMVGCLGGLGRSLSHWMVRRGAKHFIFLGRSGTQKPAAQRLIDDLEQQGAHCTVIRGDVTCPADVERAVAAADPVPLGGVIHAAMGLHEAIFSEMSHASWREGTAAKIEGAWNLHHALSAHNRDHALDFFIMTSSINGKIGTATESNYCAANNFLDVFARYRRCLGRPALSLGLGAIAEVGYLHEHSHIEELLLRKGIRFLTEGDVLQIFDLALAAHQPTDAHPRDALAQSLLLSGVEVTTLERYHQQGYNTFWHSLTDVRFAVLINALRRSLNSGSSGGGGGGGNGGGGATAESTLQSAVAAGDREQVLAAVLATVTQKLSYMVLIPVEKIDVKASLAEVAMDSMLASELRQHIFSVARVDVSFLTIMNPSTSVWSLCASIADALLTRGK